MEGLHRERRENRRAESYRIQNRTQDRIEDRVGEQLIQNMNRRQDTKREDGGPDEMVQELKLCNLFQDKN
jgi:hypothetical protein